MLGGVMHSVVYVACGRLDCFATLCPTTLQPCDLAPSGIILSEAGGVCGTELGAPYSILSPGISCASSQRLLDELFAVAKGRG
jgi:fructose-1,6-bisphosphatase/inositol monophosphatase family enzyme